MADFSKIGKSNVARSKAHERRVATLFSDWSGVNFRRRRVEGRDDAVRVVEAVADIIPSTGVIRFAIEAKCGKNFSMDAMLANPTGCLFTDWWHQVCYDASLLTKDRGYIIYPFLFFKPHPNNDWVAFSTNSLDHFRYRNTTGHLAFPNFRFDAYSWLGPIAGNVSHSKKNKKMVSLVLEPAIICRWRDFADKVDPISIFVSPPLNTPKPEIAQSELPAL